MKINGSGIAVFLIFKFIKFTRCDDDEQHDIIFNFKPCDENNMDECFREIMQTELLANLNGSKALGIPPLEPLEIEQQKVNYTGQNGVEVLMLLENVSIYGLTSSKFKDVRTKLSEKGLHVLLDVYTPRIETLGNYKANIKINELRIKPKGEFNIIINEIHNEQNIDAEFEILNDKKFLKIKNLNMNPTIGDIKFNATGIFPDPQLNDFAVSLINKYLPNFYKLIINEVQFLWEPIVIATANDFFKKVPFDRFVAL